MKLMNICRELIMEAYSGDSSITEYYVRFEASDYSEILYKGIDKVRAMAAFDGFDDVLTYYDDYMYVVMEGVVSHYKFIEDDDIKDYPIDDYYDDDTVYKLISTEEPETIERRKVKPPNRDSDEVLNGVQNYFQMRYGKRKYIKINIRGIQIRLRISDHTENIRNADKFSYVDYHISVVIADLDKTVGIYGNRNKRERRKNEFELRYDSGDKVADIILSINNFIKELVKNHNLMEGRYNKTTIREYLNENQIAQIVNTGLSVSDKIEGGFLTSKQAEELQKEIESHYTDGDATKLFGQSNNDIRQSMYNYDHPYATKNVNGVELRIGEGLVEGTPFSGNRRPTYLLYADGKIVGKFYKINDIKKVVKYIEDNLVQGHNLIEGKFMDKYSVGDIIVSDGNEPYTGGNVFPKKDKEYQLVQKDLKDFDYSRQDLYDNDPGYEVEQDSYLENLKKNFNSTPPIPEEGDGLHRIVAAKELGHDTILMWVEL
jgi:hypothetical protein